MGVTSDVHSWWSESQMRFLVLSSLVVQFLLATIITWLRRRAISGWLRSIMSLVFLGSDALAIYALATLFDRHKPDGGGRRGGSSILEVVWAPILLAHLAGLHSITAWNIEDNEKWSGYLLTSVYQVALAIYVFCKSWPAGSDNKLLRAAILLFVYGGLKCFKKPWAVKRASFTSLVRSQAGERRARQSGGQMSVVEYVEATRKFLEEDQEIFSNAQGRSGINDIHLSGEAYNLILDRSSPYESRLENLMYFWVLREDTSYECVRQGLTTVFSQFYTKFKILITTGRADLERTEHLLKAMFHQWTVLSALVLPWAAIGLFHQSHRGAYNETDVKVTYALLCCTAVLESFPFYLTFSSLSELDDLEDHKTRELRPEKVTQYSLIGYFSRNRNHSKLMWVPRMFGCKDMVDRHWGMSSCFSSGRITQLVLRYLRDGWKKHIIDTASCYHRFNDSRGHWALRSNEELRWSINGQLDESVLLWHIATDFCFFSSTFSDHRCAFDETPPRLSEIRSDEETEGDTPPGQETKSKCGELTACRAVQCREMSNYMIHLLFVNPEMLLPGTRRNLFTRAYEDLKDILGGHKLNPQSCCCCCKQVVDKGLMGTLIDRMQGRSKKHDPEIGSQEESKEGQAKRGSNGNFIDDAWHLAQGLSELRDNFGEQKMWGVIQSVWVEMLCFSASRCRGYLHAKALGSGGEFLSYVWLLMFYMGMETFTERLDRGKEVVLPSDQGNNSAAQASRAFDTNKGNMTTSPTSPIRNRGASTPPHLHTGASDAIEMAIDDMV